MLEEKDEKKVETAEENESSTQTLSVEAQSNTNNNDWTAMRNSSSNDSSKSLPSLDINVGDRPIEIGRWDREIDKRLEESRKQYEKDIQDWKPENYGNKLAGDILKNGLDAKTMEALRGREFSGDLASVMQAMNKNPEMQKAGLSVALSPDGQKLILSENGKEKQSDFIKGKQIDGLLAASGESTPESEAALNKAAAEIAAEIKASGGMSEKAIEMLRKNEHLSTGLMDSKGETRSPNLLDRINKQLEADGLKLQMRGEHLPLKPEAPVDPRWPTIGGGSVSSSMHLDLVNKDGNVKGSTYVGVSTRFLGYY